MFKISCNLKDNRTFYEYLGRWFNMDHTQLTWLASSAQAVDQHGSCWIKIAKKKFIFISFGALLSLLASFLNYSSHLKHTHKFYKQNKIKIQSSNDLSLIINWVEMTQFRLLRMKVWVWITSKIGNGFPIFTHVHAWIETIDEWISNKSHFECMCIFKLDICHIDKNESSNLYLTVPWLNT